MIDATLMIATAEGKYTDGETRYITLAAVPANGHTIALDYREGPEYVQVEQVFFRAIADRDAIVERSPGETPVTIFAVRSPGSDAPEPELTVPPASAEPEPAFAAG